MNRVKLPEVCELIMGQSPDSTSYNKSKEGLPFYQGNANFGPKYPTPTVWCSLPKKIARNNDILISVRAPIGDLNFANEECCIGRGLAALRIKDNSKYSKEYLFAFLKSIARELQRKGTGSTFTAIGKTVLEDLEINIPSLPEQQKIAAHLDSIQRAIDNKKQQLQQLDELVKSKFVEMFGETPVESGKWKVEKLKELTSKIGSGSTPKGGKGSYVEEGVSLIRSMNVHNGYFDYEDLAHLTDAQAKSLDGVKIEEGDVLINITGASVARCCIVPSDVLPARVNQHVSILRIKRDLMSVFLNYFLISDEEQFALLDIGGGGGATREAITKTELENLVVPVPPIDLQNTFAEYVQKIDSAKSIIKTQLVDLQELLDSKMDEYFGE